MFANTKWQKNPAKKSVQQSKHPQRDSVFMPDFSTVNSKETIRFILYLLERLAKTANFEQVLAINKEITLCWICDWKHLPYLIE